MSPNGVMRLLVLGGFVIAAFGKSLPRVVDKDASQVHQDGDLGNRSPFNLEETYDQSFRAYGFNGTWNTDTEIIFPDKYTGEILVFDVTTKSVKIFLGSSVTALYDQASLSFSHDNKYILIGYDTTAGFRHSSYKKFDVFDTKRKTYEKIANGSHIPLAEWSPVSNSLVYVLDNDIYYKSFAAEDQEPRRLTTTGVYGVVYNGVPDWVYEEEVLGTSSALWFSKDGRHLAFATFDDSGVRDATVQHYGEPGSLEDQYTTEVKIKYPKAGTPNPIVSLSVVDLTKPSSKLVKLEPPTDVVGVDNILFTVNWWQNFVVATWTNRVQNKAQLVLYNTDGEANNLLYEEETHGWLRIKPPMYHGQYFIITKLQESGTAAGGFLHATRFEYADGKLTKETDLTPGAAEVQSIIAIDHKREKLYYLAAAIGQPSQRNLYSVDINGNEKPVCISCEFLTPEGNNCTYASAAFSKEASYYTLSCSGPDPTIITVFDANQKQVLLWESNESLRKKLANRVHPLVKDLYVRANGYDSKVRLLLPHNFDEKKSYPLLINVYAGPNTVRITEAANYGLQSYMATNRSVIYGWIDGRGSAYRGSKMLYEIYRRLGSVEVEDQISVTRTLLETYPWIDASRTGIWGWSYGGFSTAMTLAIDKDSVFKCGISVAPVTSWIYYDSIYTERFMGLPTPDDNLEGYNNTDINRKVEGIRGKKFMLIHGTGDDNVHFQQAMALTRSLAEKDIMFEQLSYPDEAHGLVGLYTHLYHTMDRFWDNCFDYSRSL